MRNVSDKNCKQNQNTFYVQYFFFLENRTVYEIMWKSTVEPERPQMITLRMHTAYWIPKPTNTHLEYVIFIAFLPQQYLHANAAMLE